MCPRPRLEGEADLHEVQPAEGGCEAVDHEVEALVDLLEVLVAHIVGFDPVDQPLDALLQQELAQAAVGRSAAGGPQQSNPGVVVVFAGLLAGLLGLGDDLVDQIGLSLHQLFHQRPHR